MTQPLRHVLLLAGLAALLPAPFAAAEPQSFRVLNRTGQTATQLFAVRTPRGAQNDWGRSVLTRALPPEESFGLRANEAAGCRFDLRLVLADGREARLANQDICAHSMVVLETTQAGATVTAKPPALEGPARPPGQPGQPGQTPGRTSSGTGFVVARGQVLTNLHVVDGCRRITVRAPEGAALPASTQVPPDSRRDLALLTVEGETGPPLRFRSAPAVRRGEAVVSYGFPLSGILSSGPTLTTGEVNALSGMRDNAAQFQISAPVQPGNSGGPLLDRQGNVLGVVVSKLNAANIAARTGDIPQNVNFAVKGTEALEYLRGAGVTPLLAESTGRERSAAEVGELVHRSTVLVRCER